MSATIEQDAPVDEAINHELNGEATSPSVPEPSATEQAQPLPPPSPAELRRRHYEEIVRLNRQVDEAWHDWQTAKAEAAELKKGYDGLVQQLRKTVKRDPLQREVLEEPATVLPDGDAWASDGDNAEPVESDAWKSVSVADLEIGKSLTSKLEHHGIETLGQLQEFWSAGKDLKDLKGIGEESAAKIADKYADFGAANPHLWVVPLTAVEAEADDFNAEHPSLGGANDLATDGERID